MTTLSEPGLLKDRCYVNGQWAADESGEAVEVRNPADGSRAARVPSLSETAVDAAVAAAQAAFDPWR